MSPALRVGLNLLHLTPRSGGMHTYARELARALLTADAGVRLTAFAGRDLPADMRRSQWADEVDWVSLPVSWSYGRPWNPLAIAAAQWAALPALARRRRLDVLHGMAGIGPPAHPGVSSVVTVPDAIWLRHPHTMSRRATLAMRVFVPPGAHRADRVIALSRDARDDVVARLRLDPDRVEVVAHGAAAPEAPEDAQAVRRALDLGESRVLACVSQLLPHKNLAALVRAAASLPEDARLVVVGAPTPHELELRALVAQLGAADRVRFAGWLPRERLEGVYALAAGVVLPSLDEGFGLTALEAMRRGVPVACSDIPVLREVTGEAALRFDPHDPAAIESALRALLREADEETAKRVAAGRERARELTWQRAARGTLAAYERALEPRARPRRRAMYWRAKDATKRGL